MDRGCQYNNGVKKINPTYFLADWRVPFSKSTSMLLNFNFIVHGINIDNCCGSLALRPVKHAAARRYSGIVIFVKHAAAHAYSGMVIFYD